MMMPAHNQAQTYFQDHTFFYSFSVEFYNFAFEIFYSFFYSFFSYLKKL